MFSINLVNAYTSKRAERTLHSTMFSINREIGTVEECREAALHSTMFSINPPLAPDVFAFEIFFTFHYVFY